MRLRTYGKAVQKYDDYETVANERVLAVMEKFMRRACSRTASIVLDINGPDGGSQQISIPWE